MSARTQEQIDNIMRYGVCLECGAARKPEMLWTTTDDDERICSVALVCENGHEQ